MGERAVLLGLAALFVACEDEAPPDRRRGAGGDDPGAGVVLDTLTSTRALLVGEEFDISCRVDGQPDDLSTSVILNPDSLARLDGRRATAMGPGEIAVACRIVDGTTGAVTAIDVTPAIVEIRAAGPRSIDTLLSAGRIAAGEGVDVRCAVADALGRPLDAPTVFVVDPDPGPDAAGPATLSPSAAGVYAVTCKTRQGDVADPTPATLEVVHGAGASLVLEVAPIRDVYAVGDVVEVRAIVTDRHGNPVAEPPPEWELSAGVEDLGGGAYRLGALGVLSIAAHLPAPLQAVRDDATFVVDGSPPSLELFEPERGAVRSGEPAVRVRGRAADAGTGLRAVRVNGEAVAVDRRGGFDVTLEAVRGLNLVRVEAEDAAGAVARTTRGVLYSPALLPIPDGDEAGDADARRRDGMVAFLGQAALDDGDHPCRFAEDGTYVCDEVDDLATVLEILLNDTDYGALPPIVAFDEPFELVREGAAGQLRLGGGRLELPPILNLQGDIVLHWSTEIRVGVQVVAEVSDLDINGYRASLTARDGGLVAGGRMGPVAGRPGISAGLDARVEVDVEAYVRIDRLTWGADDVTPLACGNEIFPPIIIGFVEDLLDADLAGPLCDHEPAASVHPQAVARGAGFGIEALSFTADLDASLDADGEPDVRLAGPPVTRLGAGTVDLTMFEDLTVDLGEVEVFDMIHLDLGEFEADLAFLQALTDALVDPLVNVLRDDTDRIIAAALDCSGDGPCPVDLASAVEHFLASVAGARVIPTELLPGQAAAAGAAGAGDGDDAPVLTTEGVFSLLDFTAAGGVVGLSTLAVANREPGAAGGAAPPGIPVRAGCLDGGDAVPGPAEAELQFAVHADHWNQALHAVWRTGLAHRRLAGEALPPPSEALEALGRRRNGDDAGAVEVIDVVFEPAGPLAAETCNAKGDVHLLAGDVRVTVGLETAAGPQALTGWVSLDRLADLRVAGDERLTLEMAGLAGLLWEPDATPPALLGDPAAAEAVAGWLTDAAVPAWLAAIGELTLTTLATPTWHLGVAPGVPDGVAVRVAARDAATLDGYQMVRGALTAGR